MRATVILSEYLTYMPAIIIFLRHYCRSQGVGRTSASVALVAVLMQPATILIDHGHFQYNTVMLGLVVASLSSIYADRLLWACILFVAAVGFKQMALYYSPIIFAYLLGACVTPRIRPARLISIALITTVAFVALFMPILLGALLDGAKDIIPPGDPMPPLLDMLSIKRNTTLYPIARQVTQVIHRSFPFARGVFEDKVANFWCSLNTVYKLRNLNDIISLPRLSMYFTFISVLAPTLIVCAIPRKSLLPYALASSAWGFFLFSFQVHEKSVLLPLLPMTLLLASKNGFSKEYRAWIGWANLLGVWTLYPLLKRDQLKTPYVVVSLLWSYLLGLPPTSVDAYYGHANQSEPGKPLASTDLSTGTKVLHLQCFVVMALWHLLEAFAEPPDSKPDLWAVVNACLGAAGFGICYLWCTWKLVLESGILDDYFMFRKTTEDRMGVQASGKKSQ